MNPIVLNLLLGIVIIPVLLFLLAGSLSKLRAKRGLQPVPPNKISFFVILGGLASWIIAGINILMILLQRG